MSLRIRRGTEAQRPSATFDLGEIVYTTDTNKLYVGDGVNLGGKNILATSAGLGLAWNTTTQRLDFTGSGTGILTVNADTSPTLGGNLNLNTRNITGTGNINITGTVTATQFVGTRVSTDTSPTLGGNLNLSSRNITGTGDINITGTVTATQFVGTRVIADTLPSLGGNLTLNSNSIIGSGNIDITGNITATNIGSSTIRIVGNLIISTVAPVTGVTGVSSNNPVTFGNTTTPASLWLNSTLDFGYFTGLTNGTANSGLQFRMSRGTLSAPTALQAGDATAFIQGNGYNGTNYVITSAIGLTTDFDWNGTLGAGGQVPGSFGVVVIDIAGAQKFLSFNSKGILNAPVIKTDVYSVATTALPSASTSGVGSRAFVLDATVSTFGTAYTGGGTNKVPVYSNGTSWLIG